MRVVWNPQISDEEQRERVLKLALLREMASTVHWEGDIERVFAACNEAAKRIEAR